MKANRIVLALLLILAVTIPLALIVSADTSVHTPNAQSFIVGSMTAGTFPTDIETSNNIRITVTEGNAGGAGGFPVVANVNNSEELADTLSHNVFLPENIVSGELIIVMFGTDGVPTITWPSGWTQLFSQASGTGTKLEARYRIADGTEGTTIVVTTDVIERSEHRTWKITDFDPATPPEVGTAATGISVNPDPPFLAPSWGQATTLWIAMFGADGSRTVSVYPSGYTDNQFSDNSGGGPGNTQGSATQNLLATSDNPSTFTMSTSDDWVAQTLAVKPASPNYQIDGKYSWTGVPTLGTEWRLFIEGSENFFGENLEVQIYGSDEVSLSGVVCTINTGVDVDYDCGALTTDQLDGGTPDIRIVDAVRTLDSVQDSWLLDFIRIVRTFTANNAPTLTQDYSNPTIITRDQAIEFGVIYTDADNDAPTYVKIEIVSVSNRSLGENDTGDVTYTDGKAYRLNDPANTYCPAVFTFFFSTSDGNFPIRTTNRIFTVSNTVPSITNGGSAPTSVVHGNGYSFDFDASDVDVPTCQSLTWTMPVGPGWLSIAPSTGILSGTSPDNTGPNSVTVRASDGTSFDEVSFGITVTNTAPTFTAGEQSSENVGLGPYTHDYDATDPDSLDEIYFTMNTNNSELFIGPFNGTVYGNLATAGVFYVNVTVHDQAIPNGTAFNNYTLTVTAAPPIPLEFTSTPITSGILHTEYQYQATTNKTGVTFSLDDAPFWLSITSAGLLFGAPLIGVFNVSIRATKGSQIVWQNYTLTISALGQADWTVILLVFVFVMLIILGFAHRPIWHILALPAGIFLAIEAYSITTSAPISILISGVAVLFGVVGIANMMQGD